MTENTIIWNTYSLIEVETAEDKALFHRVMDGVYANDPDFIYPLENDVEGVFDPAKNKSFLTGAARRWVVMDDNASLLHGLLHFIHRSPSQGSAVA